MANSSMPRKFGVPNVFRARKIDVPDVIRSWSESISSTMKISEYS